jgi:hypothetical protein
MFSAAADVLVEHAEVDHARRVDRRRHQRALVELPRLLVLAAQIDVDRQPEQRLLVARLESEHLVVAGDRALGVVLQLAHAPFGIEPVGRTQHALAALELGLELLRVGVGLHREQPGDRLPRIGSALRQHLLRVVDAAECSVAAADAVGERGVALLLEQSAHRLLVAAERPQHEVPRQACRLRARQPFTQMVDRARRTEHLGAEAVEGVVVDLAAQQRRGVHRVRRLVGRKRVRHRSSWRMSAPPPSLAVARTLGRDGEKGTTR